MIRRERDENNKVRSTLKLFDVDTGDERRSIAVAGDLSASRFSPDGKRLAGTIRTPVGDGSFTDQLAVWDVTTGSQVFAVHCADFILRNPSRPPSRTVVWSPDGKWLALPGQFGSRLQLRDAATGKLVKTLNPSNRGATLAPGTGVAFSPDGRRIACEVRLPFGASTAVNVLDTDSGKELLSLPLPGRSRPFGLPLAFTPDGHRLLRFEPFGAGFRWDRPIQTGVFVRTWDATPLSERKQP